MPPNRCLSKEPIAWAVAVQALLVLTLASCKSKEVDPPMPPVQVRLASDGLWIAERSGHRPVIRDQANHTWLYVNGAPRSMGEHLPGLAVGGPRGPKATLLGGFYAPLVIAPNSKARYAVTIDSLPNEILEIRWLRLEKDQETPPSTIPQLHVRVFPPAKGWLKMQLLGTTQIVLPADRTEVSGTVDGKASVAFKISAGDEPGIHAPKADRLVVSTKQFGPVTLDTDCFRPRVIRPKPKGATSAFVIQAGPAHLEPDPLWAPTGSLAPPSLSECTSTGTSTLTIPAPLPNHG